VAVGQLERSAAYDAKQRPDNPREGNVTQPCDYDQGCYHRNVTHQAQIIPWLRFASSHIRNNRPGHREPKKSHRCGLVNAVECEE